MDNLIIPFQALIIGYMIGYWTCFFCSPKNHILQSHAERQKIKTEIKSDDVNKAFDELIMSINSMPPEHFEGTAITGTKTFSAKDH